MCADDALTGEWYNYNKLNLKNAYVDIYIKCASHFFLLHRDPIILFICLISFPAFPDTTQLKSQMCMDKALDDPRPSISNGG